ncbi:phage baseplate assembly protein V [Acinetobacter sp. Ac_5812]|uniref:phage baseplate assembly protein V n=1 Tax=Acinetobacter sp. Ac_5812 TaxID=1848937 RepID=UPI00148F8FE3|nr:phage baseplate assembly protein V [Acinetobacter sp. Ac_5812]NNP68968.1 hypothetical protein [Acinetobacter sp. Ac_5812]
MIDKIFHGLMNLLSSGRGIVSDDSKEVQLVQVQFNNEEIKDDIPRYTEYGFQSYPPDGHNALTLFFGGNKSSGVVVATHHPKSRKRGLKKGEVCISDDQGQEVFLSRNGITLIDKSGAIIKLNGDGTGSISSSSTFTINGVEFKDGIAKGVDFQSSGKSGLNHKHTDSRGGDTSPPQ